QRNLSGRESQRDASFSVHFDLREGQVLRTETMGNFSELSAVKQWGILALGAVLLTGVLYFTVFSSAQSTNATAQKALDDKMRENAELEKYRTKLDDIERQLASLKQQLEIERHIVPDEKEADGFIKMLDAEA